MIGQETVDVLNVNEQALAIAKQLLSDPEKLDALKAGVAQYTQNVDVEFQNVNQVVTAENSQVFSTNRGVGYMLWSELTHKLQQGELVTAASLTADKLTTMIYAAYTNSGASSV